MVSEDIDNYIAEIARVMKLGGVCLATYFIMDAVSRDNIAASLTSPKFAYEFKSQTCRVENPQLPEAAIAYAERFLRDLYGKHGLIIETIVHGEWVEKDSFPIGKTKFGLASCADLALETFTFEQLNQKHRAVRD